MKDKKTDGIAPQHEADISDDGMEHVDCLHELIRAEREEKARVAIVGYCHCHTTFKFTLPVTSTAAN